MKRRFHFVLLTKDFFPNHYRSLLRLFSDLYWQNGTSSSSSSTLRSSVNHRKDGKEMKENSNQKSIRFLLDCYLNLLINNGIDEIIIEQKRFSFENKDKLKREFLSGNSSFPDSGGHGDDHHQRNQLRSIIKLFSLDFILVYTALLLKKRIIVYHHDPKILFDFAVALPDLMPHRPDARHQELVPNIDLMDPKQINDLQRRSHFIATFLDARVSERESLFDIFINLAAIEITIPHERKEIFAMTKTHKEIAIALVRVANKDDSDDDDDIIKEVSKKTNEILSTLHTSFLDSETRRILDDDRLEERFNSSPSSLNLKQFYWNLALAEGFKF